MPSLAFHSSRSRDHIERSRTMNRNERTRASAERSHVSYRSLCSHRAKDPLFRGKTERKTINTGKYFIFALLAILNKRVYTFSLLLSHHTLAFLTLLRASFFSSAAAAAAADARGSCDCCCRSVHVRMLLKRKTTFALRLSLSLSPTRRSFPMDAPPTKFFHQGLDKCASARAERSKK